MSLLTIIIILVVFLLGYFAIDAWHDNTVKKDKDNAVRAGREILPEYKKKFSELSLKYNKRWHIIDSFQKGYVISFLIFALVGWSWLILIFFELAFAIRWVWFDLNINWHAGRLPFYTGSVSTTDKLTKKVWAQIALKSFFIIIGVGLLIVYWYKVG